LHFLAFFLTTDELEHKKFEYFDNSWFSLVKCLDKKLLLYRFLLEMGFEKNLFIIILIFFQILDTKFLLFLHIASPFCDSIFNLFKVSLIRWSLLMLNLPFPLFGVLFASCSKVLCYLWIKRSFKIFFVDSFLKVTKLDISLNYWSVWN
jgi:hypothetical protein